jgi:hypothetical protein
MILAYEHFTAPKRTEGQTSWENVAEISADLAPSIGLLRPEPSNFLDVECMFSSDEEE